MGDLKRKEGELMTAGKGVTKLEVGKLKKEKKKE